MGFDRSHATMITAGVVVAFAGLTAAFGLWFFQDPATAGSKADRTEKIQIAAANLGPSGLPVPRFVSLKRDKVNVRRGPSTSHKVAWVFTSKGYPVEIIAESDHWRRVRDAEGEEGWVYHSLLSGWRNGVISPWNQGAQVALQDTPGATAATVAKATAAAVNTVRRRSARLRTRPPEIRCYPSAMKLNA